MDGVGWRVEWWRRGTVLAAWQCWSHLTSNVQPGKRVLKLSVDETSVAYWDTKKQKGNVAVSRRAARGKATTRQLRMHLTHIAVICDDPEIQPHLPQILLVAGAILPLGIVDDICAILPSNVEVWRAKSGWVNSRIFKRVVERIAEALEPYKATHQAILQLDVFAPHYDIGVLKAAASSGLWVSFIPAKLTWLLQVLDVFTFAKYKEHLRSLFAKERSLAPNGEVSILSWIRIICDTIQSVLHGSSWGPCFERNGFSEHLAAVRPAIWAHTGLTLEATALSVRRPTWEQLRAIFPALPPPYPDLFPPPPRAALGALGIRRLRVKTPSAC